VALTEEMAKLIQDQLVAVQQLRRDEKIDENVYHKCMVAIAYEYAVRDEGLRAAALIQTIPIEYFRNVQPQQMRDDPAFCTIAFVTAMKLVKDGFVEIGPKLVINQGPANA
jgi:hypothetical protein